MSGAEQRGGRGRCFWLVQGRHVWEPMRNGTPGLRAVRLARKTDLLQDGREERLLFCRNLGEGKAALVPEVPVSPCLPPIADNTAADDEAGEAQRPNGWQELQSAAEPRKQLAEMLDTGTSQTQVDESKGECPVHPSRDGLDDREAGRATSLLDSLHARTLHVKRKGAPVRRGRCIGGTPWDPSTPDLFLVDVLPGGIHGRFARQELPDQLPIFQFRRRHSVRSSGGRDGRSPSSCVGRSQPNQKSLIIHAYPRALSSRRQRTGDE